MIGKRKPVSRAELVAHVEAGKAQQWLDNIAQSKRVLLNGKNDLPASLPGNACDEIIELLRLRELLVSGEPLHALDRGNLVQVVHRAMLDRLEVPAGRKAQRLRDPWVALDYALRKWVLGKARGKTARADVARRWGMQPSNVARIWTDHDKSAERRLREMKGAARKRGGTRDEQIAYMLQRADQWPAMVAQREQALERFGSLHVPGVNLVEVFARF